MLFSAPFSKPTFSPIHTRNGAFSEGSTFGTVYERLPFHQRFRSFQCERSAKTLQKVCAFKRKRIGAVGASVCRMPCVNGQY